MAGYMTEYGEDKDIEDGVVEMIEGDGKRQLRTYVILIEWDGKRPPSKYYRRLHQIAGLRVRQQADADVGDVLASRLSSDGLIVQEGAIVVGSYSMARRLAAFIHNGITVETATGPVVHRPAAIMFGEAKFSQLTLTNDEIHMLEVLERRFSQRGKTAKSDLEGSWTVTCYEEMRSHQVDGVKPHSCPSCGAAQISCTPSKPVACSDPGGDLYDAWLATRFCSGRWQPPTYVAGAPAAVAHKIADSAEREFAEAVAGSTLLEQVGMVIDGREQALRVLDAAFVQRVYWRDARRSEARARAMVEYVQAWQGAPVFDGIVMYETPKPDIFDAAGMLESEWGGGFASAIAKAWQEQRAGAATTVTLPSDERMSITDMFLSRDIEEESEPVPA